MAISLRSRLLASFVGLAAIVSGGLMFWHVDRTDAMLAQAQDLALRDHYTAMRAQIDTEMQTARALALQVASLREVQDAFAASDRERLRALLEPGFTALSGQTGVTQMQFHTPPAISFLRLHRPDHSDDLAGFRLTVIEANRTRRPAQGVEAGAAGPTVRAVRPISSDSRFLGTVEFGIDIDDRFIAGFKQRLGADIVLHVRGDDGGHRRVAGDAPTLAGYMALSQAQGGAIVTTPATPEQPKAVLTGPVRDYAGKTIAVAEISMDAARHLERRALARYEALLGFAVSLGLAALAAVTLARRIGRPLRRLTEAVHRLTGGDASAAMPGRGRADEFGTMAAALEGLRRQTRERQCLDDAAHHLAALVDSAGDAIVAITLDGIVTHWNRGAERLYGFTAAEAVGQPAADLIVPADRRGDFLAMLVAAAEGGIIDKLGTERQRKDGSRVAVELTLSPIREDGTITGASCIARCPAVTAGATALAEQAQ
ncbi:MAG TPA: cache domain-containing protein [Azospirillum sp.]|nr:cache domain-containing protein [Azospirillum sp.]